MSWICGNFSGHLHCWNESPVAPITETSFYSATDVLEIIRKNKDIEAMIERDKEIAKKSMKILLLGKGWGIYQRRKFRWPRVRKKHDF